MDGEKLDGADPRASPAPSSARPVPPDVSSRTATGGAGSPKTRSHLDRVRAAKTAGTGTSKGPAGAIAGKALSGVGKRNETAASVIKGAAQGASKGGAAGAALGAARGAAKTKAGRRVLLLSLLAGMAPMLIVLVVIVLVVVILSGSGSTNNATASLAGQAAGVGVETIDAYTEVQKDTGAPWEVLASLQFEEGGGSFDLVDQSSSAGPSAVPSVTATAGQGNENYQPTDEYIGPFHISKKTLEKEKVDPRTVLTVTGGGRYVGAKFYSALIADKQFDTGSMALDAGRVDSADGPSVINDKNIQAKQVAISYPKALAGLPVQNMDTGTAERVFQRARAWAIGNQYNDGGSNLGVICSLSAAPNAPPTASGSAAPSPGLGDSVSLPSPSANPTSSPTSSPTGGSVPDSLSVSTTGGQTLVLNKAQLTNAAIAIGVATKMGVNPNGMTAMLMTGLQEGHLLILANVNVPESETNPNKQGDGSNYDSLGFYQQRAAWGSVSQRMDATYSTRAFLGGPNGPNHGSPRGLLDVQGWETMEPGVLAQTVQVSKYPEAYDQWLPAATTILGQITGASCSDEYGTTTVSGDAKAEAKALLAVWGTRLIPNGGTCHGSPPGVTCAQQDLIDTASGAGFESCGHHVALDSDILHLYLIMVGKWVVTITNFATEHGCDPYYHPPGMATDIAGVKEIASGRTTNFYPGAAGNNPAVVADFINFVAASGPDHLGMGQQQCADHAGGGPKYQAIAFSDSCTHQHINVHQNDPQWGPYIPEKWPAGNGPKTSTS